MSNHPFTHIELSAKDLKETANFYQSVFGWQVQEFPEMNYITFETGDGPGGGFNPVSEQNPAGTVSVYINADDLPGTLEKIKAHGGKVLLENYEIPGFGWMATFQDVSGNTVSLWKSMPQS